jgi:ATP-dependent protease ClpP protease subunit
MTLLIAQRQANGNIWMVGDTAVTMGPIGLREREYKPKIIPVHDGRALAGFAGDLETCLSTILELDSLSDPSPATAISHMFEKRRGHKELGFAYAWFDGETHLVRIDNDRVDQVRVLHLGNDDAFGKFQHIRHDPQLIHPPDALRTLQIATSDSNFQMSGDGLDLAISALWLLFSSRQEHDVGGWVIPYILTENGASVVSYVYSTSDAILSRLLPGDIIPHGTATGGGFGFSLTELSDHTGFVAYWQQLPGGLILRKQHSTIKSISISGSPLEFKEKAKAAIGMAVDLWFGEDKLRRVIGTRELLDDHGKPRVRMLTHEDGSYALQWVKRTSESFQASGNIDLQREVAEPKVERAVIEQVPVVEKGARSVTTFRVLFSAPLNTASVGALQQVVEKALNDPGFRDLQLVMSSTEGQHDAGFNLYGLLRSLPVPVHIHASGVIGRISVFAFLAGYRRTCAPTATFEFHPFAWGFGGAVTITQMEFATDRLRHDVDLAREIMRRHTRASPNELEKLFGQTPIILTSSQAVAMGVVHDILDLNSEANRQETVRIASVSWQPH